MLTIRIALNDGLRVGREPSDYCQRIPAEWRLPEIKEVLSNASISIVKKGNGRI